MSSGWRVVGERGRPRGGDYKRKPRCAKTLTCCSGGHGQVRVTVKATIETETEYGHEGFDSRLAQGSRFGALQFKQT